LKKGDTVAMGFSGSFPAINLAALVAADVLELKVIAISSVASSTWGANDPDFTWLDMERVLLDAGVIAHSSIAASYGGLEDSELAKSKKKRSALRRAIERNGMQPLEFETGKEQIDERMALYWNAAGESGISAYVNVGGSTISVGTREVKKLFSPGLNKKPPPIPPDVDSVMTRFADDGIPVIHMVYIKTLLKKYGLRESPAAMPGIGEGAIYRELAYNVFLVVVSLCVLLIIMVAFLKLDIGYRIFGTSRLSQPPKHPEPMI
jgi:poly-gamma-glutamate system protein